MFRFKLFALLNQIVEDEVMSEIQNVVETLAEDLVCQAAYQDDSDIYADRSNNVCVSYLSTFVRLNLDYVSLERADSNLNILG